MQSLNPAPDVVVNKSGYSDINAFKALVESEATANSPYANSVA